MRRTLTLRHHIGPRASQRELGSLPPQLQKALAQQAPRTPQGYRQNKEDIHTVPAGPGEEQGGSADRERRVLLGQARKREESTGREGRQDEGQDGRKAQGKDDGICRTRRRWRQEAEEGKEAETGRGRRQGKEEEEAQFRGRGQRRCLSHILHCNTDVTATCCRSWSIGVFFLLL